MRTWWRRTGRSRGIRCWCAVPGWSGSFAGSRGQGAVRSVPPPHRRPPGRGRHRDRGLPARGEAQGSGPHPRRAVPLPGLLGGRPVLRPRPRPALADRPDHRREPDVPVPASPPDQATTRVERAPGRGRHRDLDRPRRSGARDVATQPPRPAGPARRSRGTHRSTAAYRRDAPRAAPAGTSASEGRGESTGYAGTSTRRAPEAELQEVSTLETILEVLGDGYRPWTHPRRAPSPAAMARRPHPATHRTPSAEVPPRPRPRPSAAPRPDGTTASKTIRSTPPTTSTADTTDDVEPPPF